MMDELIAGEPAPTQVKPPASAPRRTAAAPLGQAVQTDALEERSSKHFNKEEYMDLAPYF